MVNLKRKSIDRRVPRRIYVYQRSPGELVNRH